MNRKEIKFEVDKDHPVRMKVHLEGQIDRSYTLGSIPKSPKELVTKDLVLHSLRRDDFGGGLKGAYRSFTVGVGLTPSKYLSLVRGKYYELVIKPVDDLVRKYGITSPGGKARVSPNRLEKIIVAEDKIRQAQEDGLDNLVPLILNYNMCPKDLRKLFGRSLWKRICKNSHYRNLKITEGVEYNILFGPNLGHKLGSIKQDVDEYIEDLPASKMRAVLGNNLFILDLLSTGDVAKGLVFSLPTKVLEEAGVNMLSGIIRELKKLSLSPLYKNIKNWDNLLELHSQMSDTLRWIEVQKTMSSDPYENLSWLNEKEGEYEGVKWKIISNNKELYKEAEEMKHCVYSYRDLIANGKYIVVSLECNGERATVGHATYKRFGGEIGISKESWSLEQLYGKMISSVKSHKIRSCSEYLLKYINHTYESVTVFNKEAA